MNQKYIQIRDILYNIPYRVSSSTDFSSSVKDNEKSYNDWKGRNQGKHPVFMEIEEAGLFFTLSTSSGSIKDSIFQSTLLEKKSN